MVCLIPLITFVLWITPMANSLKHALNMGSKTAYENLARHTGVLGAQSQDYMATEWPPNCMPIQVNGLIRHGTRNAGDKDIRRFAAMVDKLETTNTVQDTYRNVYNSFLHMRKMVLSHKEKSLVPQGYEEQYNLGKNIFSKFESLLYDVNSTDINFVASSSQRTIDSSTAFMRSWRELANRAGLNPKLHINDDTMRFFDHCKKYSDTVAHNKEALNEYRKFKEDIYQSVLNDLHDKCSLLDEKLLPSSKDLKSLYIMAGLEIAILKTDHIAQLFSPETIKLMEYAADVKHYWKKSYGHEVNYQQSCVLLVDIMKHLEDAIHDKNPKKAVLRFGHCETLLPLLALLGLHQDPQPLKASNYNIHGERQFKASYLSPFSANLFFVLYECDIGKSDNDYFVQLLLNEKPTMIPGCEQLLCPYNVFKQKYGHVINSCNFDVLCNYQHDDL